MVCQACGTPVVESVHYCAKCGAQIVLPPQPPAYAGPVYPQPPLPFYVPRVRRNLQALGILWCVLGAYRLVAGFIGAIFLRSMTFDDRWMFGRHWTAPMPPSFFGHLWPVIAVTAICMAALALITGYGLLQRRPWGRTLSIVAAILALFKFPFGTALGIYTLWVMAPSTSGMEYDSIADRT